GDLQGSEPIQRAASAAVGGKVTQLGATLDRGHAPKGDLTSWKVQQILLDAQARGWTRERAAERIIEGGLADTPDGAEKMFKRVYQQMKKDLPGRPDWNEW